MNIENKNIQVATGSPRTISVHLVDAAGAPVTSGVAVELMLTAPLTGAPRIISAVPQNGTYTITIPADLAPVTNPATGEPIPWHYALRAGASAAVARGSFLSGELHLLPAVLAGDLSSPISLAATYAPASASVSSAAFASPTPGGVSEADLVSLGFVKNSSSQGLGLAGGKVHDAGGVAIYSSEAYFKGVAIGTLSDSRKFGVAIGSGATANERGVALGANAVAAEYSVAICGESATDSVCILGDADAESSVAVGKYARTGGMYALTMGVDTHAGLRSIVLGSESSTWGQNVVILGNNIGCRENSCVVIGSAAVGSRMRLQLELQADGIESTGVYDTPGAMFTGGKIAFAVVDEVAGVRDVCKVDVRKFMDFLVQSCDATLTQEGAEGPDDGYGYY